MDTHYVQSQAPIIGLIGKKRVGKDTFAETLTAEFGFVRTAFADPLKQFALQVDPLVGPAPIPGDLPSRYRPLSDFIDALGWEAAKDTVPGVRQTLQRLGGGVRQIDPDFWVDTMESHLHEYRCSACNVVRPVVITDVRMPNEAYLIKEYYGGVLVRIERPGLDNSDLDVSETALDDYDDVYAVVVNDGTLDDLRERARRIAGSFIR